MDPDLVAELRQEDVRTFVQAPGEAVIADADLLERAHEKVVCKEGAYDR